MSASNDAEGDHPPVIESVDTATVEKVLYEKFETVDDRHFPGIVYDLSVDGDTEQEVVLTDPLPGESGATEEEIGFHPNYGKEYWTHGNDGEAIRFSRTLEVGEESFQTVVGLRDPDDIDLEAAAETTPALQVESMDTDGGADPETSPQDAQVDADEQETEATIDHAPDPSGRTGDGETSTDGASADETATSGAGTDSETTTSPAPAPGRAGQHDGETVQTDNPTPDADHVESSADRAENAAEEAREAAAVATDAAEQAMAAAQEAPTEGDGERGETMLTELTAELKQADEREVAAFRQQLGVDSAGGLSNSDQTQLEHLATKVSELEAYISGLEAFIDENGEAQEVLQQVQQRQDRTAESIEDLEAELETVRDTLAEIQDDIETVEQLRDVFGPGEQ